jgi:hypothetical protein
LRQWRTWTHQEPALRGLSWHQFVVDLATGDPGRQDQLLAALARIARHDSESLDVIVAALAPGVRARIKRYAPGLPLDDAYSVATIGICAIVAACPVPEQFIASRLLDAAKRQLGHAVQAEIAWQTHSQQPTNDDAPIENDLSGLILATAVDSGELTRPDAWLLHATIVDGHPLDRAAHRLGISYEAAKKRRQRARARLRAWLAPITAPHHREVA